MAKLDHEKCKPCEEGTQPLKGDELKELEAQLPEGWEMVEEHHLQKSFGCEDFRQALDLANRIGEVAEQENHHPDLHVSYGKVEAVVWTHKVGGLTRNDFILASKIDALRRPTAT